MLHNSVLSFQSFTMTLYEFNALNEDQQVETLWEWGEYLMRRAEGRYQLVLYQLHSFYVEVWYQVKDNEISRVRSFSSPDALEPYLKMIELPEFF